MNRKVNPVLHESIVAQYNNGYTLDDLGKKYGLTGGGIHRIIARSGLPHRGHRWGVKSKVRRESANNPMWRGDNVGMTALHGWVSSRKPKPEFCEECGVNPPFDLATVGDNYTRNLGDWEWLCRSCHMKKDGRINNLKQYAGVSNGK